MRLILDIFHSLEKYITGITFLDDLNAIYVGEFFLSCLGDDKY
jgi:hypothetical protein